MPGILIVEDDLDLANIVQIHLRKHGYETCTAHDCASALVYLQNRSFDLILLDVLLPDQNGKDFCRMARDLTSCPIIFMSCLDDTGTVVSALANGGDDYVTKPIKYDELIARIESNIRRYHNSLNKKASEANKHILRFKRFSVDTERRRVIINGEETELSAIEYSLLSYFIANQDTLLLYDSLYSKIWGNDSLGDIRTVMVHISNLRKKIDPGKAGIIETVRGAGYIFSDV
jgi:DNA-binding response OmpR family regulator